MTIPQILCLNPKNCFISTKALFYAYELFQTVDGEPGTPFIMGPVASMATAIQVKFM